MGESLPPATEPGLKVCTTLPMAFSAQVVSVTVATDTTVNLALNSGLTVMLGTATDLSSKYEDVAAVIAHASLRGKKVIDVTVPDAPAVG
ncbi:MAG: cell division protein FtsQ/DivIB [Acidimicrobiales bacterium]